MTPFESYPNGSRGVPLLTVLLTFLGVACDGLRAFGHPPARGQHALLIGCTDYQHVRPLVGPRNDVALLEKLLVEKYRFPPQNVVKLVGGVAQGKQAPTRANIEREFKRLADKKQVKPGDTVVVLFAGHGSQQPDQVPEDPNDPEPDGLDEILLPVDAKPNKSGRTVENAILDDELRQWLRAITENGASVWVILDACQSGTATRGEVARSIGPRDLVSEEALAAAAQEARRRAATPNRAASPPEAFLTKRPDQEPDLVSLYAALPTEVTVELPLPPRAAKRETYGLLTYTLCHILANARAPLTYRDLVDRVYAQYDSWGRLSPTPLVEGKRRHFFVLGETESVRHPILLSRADNHLWVNAGELNGLAKDSVLAVRPPAGEANETKVLGHVRVEELRVLTSRVVPHAHDGTAAPAVEGLPAGARCEPVLVDLGDHRLRVAVELAELKDEPAKARAGREAERDRLRQELGQLARAPTTLFTVVADPVRDSPQWLVRVEGDGVYLCLASELASGPGGPRGRFDPAPRGDRTAAWLAAALEKIARAEILKGVATRLQNEPPTATGREIQLAAALLLLEKLGDAGRPLTAQANAMPVLREGDLFTVGLKNQGAAYHVDVYVLFIYSDYGIDVYFPSPFRVLDNRLPPEKEIRVPAARVVARTVGVEQVVVLAVRSKGQGLPPDFGQLTQAGVREPQREARAKTLLDQFALLFPESRDRAGLRLQDVEQIQARVFTFRTESRGPRK